MMMMIVIISMQPATVVAIIAPELIFLLLRCVVFPRLRLHDVINSQQRVSARARPGTISSCVLLKVLDLKQIIADVAPAATVQSRKNGYKSKDLER
jgi:hypothetical protein